VLQTPQLAVADDAQRDPTFADPKNFASCWCDLILPPRIGSDRYCAINEKNGIIN